jgi:L-asparaginase II
MIGEIDDVVDVERVVCGVCEPANPVIAYQTRCGIVENIHRGSICSVQVHDDGRYDVVYSAGDISRPFYLRSALKYVQILPMLESGAVEHYNFSDAEIAVMCSSHDAEPFHLEAVRGILSKAGLTELQLGCGPHTPMHEASAFRYVREGTPTPFSSGIYNNCSGKHAGFLALCKFKGFPLEGYLSPSHPLQQLILSAASDVFGVEERSIHIGIDGCSAPTYAIPLVNAALGYAKLSRPEPFFSSERTAAVHTMLRAVTSRAEYVWGSSCTAFDTLMMTCTGGRAFGKRGASGGYVMGVRERGLGCAVKVDDGLMIQYFAAMKFLDWVGVGIVSARRGSDQLHTNAISGEDEDGETIAPTERQITDFLKFRMMPNRDYQGAKLGVMVVPKTLFPGSYSSAGTN